jgi:geranylgeranyl pyrophosphate synthase
VAGSTDGIGKTVGADAAHHKPTYPAVVGLAESAEVARGLQGEALASLSILDSRADPLRQLAQFIVDRPR